MNIPLPSELYPFRLADLSAFQYEGFVLENVFESITPEQQQACVEMWLRNQVLPSEQAALARSNEVCYYIYHAANGKLIGVNTLYTGSITVGGPTFYLNRMFIDPYFRNSRLMIIGTAMMLCFAKTQLASRGLPGVVNVNENRKLSRPGMQRIFQRLGYQQLGWQQGNEVLFFEFDRVNYVEQP